MSPGRFGVRPEDTPQKGGAAAQPSFDGSAGLTGFHIIRGSYIIHLKPSEFAADVLAEPGHEQHGATRLPRARACPITRRRRPRVECEARTVRGGDLKTERDTGQLVILDER